MSTKQTPNQTQATNEAASQTASQTAGTGTGPTTEDLATKVMQEQEDDAFADKVADRVVSKTNHLKEGEKQTPEQRLAEAEVDEKIKAIQRKGEFRNGLKVGAAWVIGAVGAVFGMTLASAAAMRISKSKLGIDLEPKPIIVTDAATAQMLLGNLSDHRLMNASRNA